MRAVIPLIIGLLAGLFAPSLAPAPLPRYSFDDSASGWMVYDYNGGSGGENVWYAVDWSQSGGIGDSGYISADDSKWRIDTPESPHSVLALILYQSWLNAPPLDLRGATVTLHLRGDNLDLRGARVYFWIYSQGTRYHLVTQPLIVPAGAWSDTQRLTLAPEPSAWHQSWRWSDGVPSLPDALANVESYGISFVGFDGEPTGALHMDELTMTH